jgi:alkanesulfonate monooxygenase SsuD/methylene tetrahydromethanopterin reductase-like flavin-dependent oxidoreductase (luciferase family)
MQVGLMYGFQAPERFGRSAEQVYREGLEQVRWADRAGFDAVWMTEHHFFADGYCPSPMTVCAAAAAVTERVRICQGIVVLPTYGHPLRLAEDAAVIDLMSGGRLELGIGQGYRQDEYDGFGLDFKARRRMFLEGWDILDAALGGERFSYEGRHFSVLDGCVRPRPAQQPFPPLWLGAATPTTRRRVAERGGNLLISLLTDRDHTRAQFDGYRADLAAVGRDPAASPIALIRECHVAEDRDRAFAEVLPHLHYMYKEVYVPPHATFVERLPDGGRRTILDPSDPYYDTEAFWKDRFIIGDPESAAAEIVRYRDELGIDQLVLHVAHPGMAHETVMRCMELLVDRVLPAVAATPRRA